MDVVFDLPDNLIRSLFENWLSVCDLCKMDSALLCSRTRIVFLDCLRSPHAVYTGLIAATKVDTHCYFRWLGLRGLNVHRELNLKQGYKFICKKLPSLCDVVGSADSSQGRGTKTEQAVGGVFNYTADSIESILLAMKLPETGLRFLDAGCGNAIFLTIIRMSFPTAEVVGLDLQPVVTTLQSIQQYCNYEPFKHMRLVGMDICTPQFAPLVHTFAPTHAACIIGLEQEEASFLAAVQATPSVVCIAVAEKRNPVQATDFNSYGFVQTHRVVVHLAGSRKKRHVLVAVRKVSAVLVPT